MPEFELVEPFDVDDGSLDGLSPAVCFTLGVEWAMFRAKAQTHRPFTEVVHHANARRLVAMVERQGRFVESRPERDGWCFITVGDAKVE